jgi:hypothetical protein
MVQRAGFSVVLCGVATFVLASLVATPASGAATLHVWTLSGVTFADGGTLTGSLVIGGDGTPQGVDVTTAGGNTGTFGTYNYNSAVDTLAPNVKYSGWQVMKPDLSQYLMLKLPDTSQAQENDSLPLPSGGFECTNCGSVRAITSGSIVEGALVDYTAPAITPVVDPASPDGTNGWYRSSPMVSFIVDEPDSPISDQSGCDPETVSADTASTTFTCQATSLGGTNSASVTISRDATAPTIAPNVTTDPVRLNGPIHVPLHAADALSGLASAGCGELSTADPGVYTVACNAVDVAGNETDTTVAYTVQFVMAKLVVTGKRRVGHSLSIATGLTDATGHRLPGTEASALGCRVKFAVSGAQTHHGCLTYDKSTHTFGSSWTVGKHTGASTVTVTVSYPHSSVKTSRTKAVTITK